MISKTRNISISLEPETIAAVDDAADLLHISRSAMCNMILAGVLREGQTLAMLSEMLRLASAGKEDASPSEMAVQA